MTLPKQSIFFFIALTFSWSQMLPYQMPLQSKVPINHSIQVNDLNLLEIVPLELDLIESVVTVFPSYLISKNEIHLDQQISAQLLLTSSYLGHVDLFIEDVNTNAMWGPFHAEDGIFFSPIINGKDFVITAEFSNLNSNASTLIIEDIVKFTPETRESVAHPNHRNKNRENPIILVTGFWPPTNEMIRHFSQNESLNPNGWEGGDWEERGYDVVSYFPEFETPDCDDCGIGIGDFEVDYQDTSEDYWPIVNQLNPIAIITFSRGWIDHSWEMEFNFYNRLNWYGDYETPMLPTPNPPDNSVANYFIRHSTLPVENVVDAINDANLGLDPYVDWNGNPGQFVSEFMGYHGVWYKDTHSFGDDACVIAGHIHVGGLIDWDTARQAAEISIREIINYVDQFSYTSGDINDDGIVDILDIVILVNAIMGTTELSTIQAYAADLNGDSNINIQDIILTINLILS